MGTIVVAPLGKIAELAVRHRCREMLSLVAPKQGFHRPAVIDAGRHLVIGVNDIAFAGTGNLVAPGEEHVAAIVNFARGWDRQAPLVVHCYAGISRSTASAFAIACALNPKRSETQIARQIRSASPFAHPNRLIVSHADRLLGRDGRMVRALDEMGPGDLTVQGRPFRVDIE